MFRIGDILIRNSKNFSNINKLTRYLATSAKPKVENAEENKANMSFMANLFRGEIQSKEIFPFPEPLNDEQMSMIRMMVDPVNKFFDEKNNPAKNDTNACLDEETSNGLWELGAFGLQVPAEYGGMALNNTQYARMGEIVGAKDLGIGVIVGAHQSIGFKGIMLFGTKEQKDKYLPMVSTGKTYAAFCLTEPSCGSDAGSIRCRAVKSADGKHYILNGSKIWISNGGIANVMTVFAQTEVLDSKTGKMRDKVTAFIVERNFGGIKSGPAESKMGIRCSNTTEIFFEDCKIPIENLLGAEGDGFKIAMNILNNGRFGMAGTLSGTMHTCIQKATEHAVNRVQFGHHIRNYGGIQEKLARMSMLQYCAQSMAYHVSGNMDTGSTDYHLEAAISKVFSSEAAWYVCDESIQILGGMGFMKDTGLERILRDLRIFRIFEGTNDILRLFVALTGIQYAGSHLKELQKAFKNPTANLGLIFKESSKRAIRSVGLGKSDMSELVDPSLVDSAKLCAECIDNFGIEVENLLRKYGKNIVEQQFLLNRLADAAIDIYSMSIVLSRATNSIKKNLTTADHERLMAQAWCIEGSDRVRVNLRKLTNEQFQDLYTKMGKISNNICDDEKYRNINPITSN